MKVPAISYGGPDVAADQPSPNSQKIAESGVLLELFAELSASTTNKESVTLLPKDLIQRARARFFIETVTPKLYGPFSSSLRSGEDPAKFLEGIEVLQSLLPKNNGYAVGEWSIADAAVTPFLARAEVAFSNDLGTYEEGKGAAMWKLLQEDSRYERFRKYFAGVKSRASFKDTFDSVGYFLNYICCWYLTCILGGIQGVCWKECSKA